MTHGRESGQGLIPERREARRFGFRRPAGPALHLLHLRQGREAERQRFSEGREGLRIPARRRSFGRDFFPGRDVFLGAAFCGEDAGFCGRLWRFGGAVFSIPGRREAAAERREALLFPPCGCLHVRQGGLLCRLALSRFLSFVILPGADRASGFCPAGPGAGRR